MAITFYQSTGGPVPKIEIEIYLRNAASPPDGNRDVWIIAERVAAGTSAANEVRTLPFATEADAIAWFGSGSPGAFLASYLFNFNHGEIGRVKGGIYGAAVAASGAASGAVTQTFVTAASASGTWIFNVGGHVFSVGVTSGDSITAQGDAVVAAWAALDPCNRCPLTPVNAAGTITWTFNCTGAVGNGIGVTTVQDPGITTTCTWGATATAGGTAGYPVLTTVLTALAATRTKVIICSWSDFTDTTGQAEVINHHVITKSAAPQMLGGQVIMASTDSVAQLVTNAGLVDDSNGERFCVAGRRGAYEWPAEISAKVAAAYAAEPNLGRSHDGIDINGYQVTRANAFLESEEKTLLNGGVSPVNTPAQTGAYITRLVSTRDAYGVMDFALMSVLDYVRDTLHAQIAADFPRASFVEDADLATTAEHVKTPGMFRESCRIAFKACEELGLIYGVDADFKDVDVELDLTAGTMSVALPTRMLPQGHNYRVRLDAEV